MMMNGVRRLWKGPLVMNGILCGISLGAALYLLGRYRSWESPDLAWILLPTTRLVELFSGLDFISDPGKGYIHYGHAVVIGESCAGLTFLSLSFLMAVFFFLHQFRSFSGTLAALTAFGMSAYLLTIVANASRITGAMLVLKMQLRWNLPAGDLLHMAAGTVSYGTFIVAYFLILQKVVERRPS